MNKLENIREALEYYADESNYESMMTLNGERPAPILRMKNKLALKALLELNNLDYISK